MPFEFVDNNAIDRATRRRIRSHVAIGKNAGKKLVRPSRKQAFEGRVEATAALIRVPKSLGDGYNSEYSEDIIPQVQRQVGDWFSVLSFPVKVTPQSKNLVQRAFSFIKGVRYPPELRNAIDTTGTTSSMWIQFMLLDKAFFHCAVAVSLIALNKLVIRQQDPIEAILHLSQTFRLVNEKLSGDDAASDETIAVILILTHCERLQGQYHQGLVHLQGLQRMVELRGGFQLVKSGLALKIFRADLEYSLHVGSATRFSIKDIIDVGRIPSSFVRRDNQKVSEARNSWLSRQLTTVLQELLIDITCLAWLINDAGAGNGPKLNSYIFHQTLIQFGYRLVNFSPLAGPRPTNRIENAVHLGLTAFLLTFLTGFDHRIADNPNLYELARSAAQESFVDKQENQEVLLWLLFIGGASMFRQPDDVWLAPKTTQTMHGLNLYNWEGISRMLTKFPWVWAVHDKACHWQRLSSGYNALAEVNYNDSTA